MEVTRTGKKACVDGKEQRRIVNIDLTSLSSRVDHMIMSKPATFKFKTLTPSRTLFRTYQILRLPISPSPIILDLFAPLPLHTFYPTPHHHHHSLFPLSSPSNYPRLSPTLFPPFSNYQPTISPPPRHHATKPPNQPQPY